MNVYLWHTDICIISCNQAQSKCHSVKNIILELLWKLDLWDSFSFTGSSLCRWILHFLTGRPQVVGVGHHNSSPTPARLWVEPSAVPVTESPPQIPHHQVHYNEIQRQSEIKHLNDWCKENNLELKVCKSKERTADVIRKQQGRFHPLSINAADGEGG